jgi:hypothetical protein
MHFTLQLQLNVGMLHVNSVHVNPRNVLMMNSFEVQLHWTRNEFDAQRRPRVRTVWWKCYSPIS